MIDAYLSLYDATGTLIKGESLDAAFPGHIEIFDFNLGTGERGTPAEEAAESAGDLDARLTELTKKLKQLSEMDAKTVAKNPGKNVEEMVSLASNALEDADDMRDILNGLRGNLKKSKGTPAPPKPTGTPEPTKTDGKKTGKKAKSDRLKFSISKEIDAASADLFQAYCRANTPAEPLGEDKKAGQLGHAVIVLRKLFDGKPQPYLKCTFKELELDDYGLKFSSDRMTLTEDVTFTFVDFLVHYAKQSEAGSKAPAAVLVSGTVGGSGAV